MSGAGSGAPDLLESGGPERPRRFSAEATPLAGSRVAEFCRAHRRVVGGGLAVVVVAGLLAYRWYDQRPPTVPSVRLTADRSAESVPLWSPAVDGRPSSPVTLSVSARLSVPGQQPGDPQVHALGLVGPGLSRPGVFPHSALGGSPADFDLTGQVDCDRVALPVSPEAYGVQVQATAGTRTGVATVPLGSSRAAINARVTTGCATWLAARDLTITSVRAVIDPLRPHLDLTLQVTNAGSHDGLVWLGEVSGTGTRVTPVQRTVPARGSTSVQVSADLDRCWSWSQASRPTTAADTPVPLLGVIGLSAPLPGDAVPLVQGPSGIVLAPAVAEQLQDAFVRACGGVGSPVLLTVPGSASYNADTRVLRARVVVDLPPGVVSSVRFVPTDDNGSELRPLFATSPWLTPDHTGQAASTVAFSVPPDVPCLGGGPFVALAVEVLVAEGGGERRASFELAAETALPAAQIAAACDRR